MLAILDYDAGNIESVRLALRHLGASPEFVKDADALAGAERIVFPGVGSAGQCMEKLKSRGFDHALGEALKNGTPVLAICIGMQLLFDSSMEDGGVAGLGVLPGRVRRFQADNPMTKIPHMGWNRTEMPVAHPLLPRAPAGRDYYFVHSYFCEVAWDDPSVAHAPLPSGRLAGTVYGRCDYAGVAFAAMAGRGSLFATQFHPEKSGEAGLDLLARFLRWDGKPC